MAIYGTNRITGKALAGKQHLVQSLYVLLSTPIGNRVMLPEYGSELTELLDSPITDSTRLQINKTIFDAVARWEPRFTLRRVETQRDDINGKLTITLIGIFEGQDITIEGLQPFTPLEPSTPITTPTIPETPLEPPISGNVPNFITLFANNGILLDRNNLTIGVLNP